LADVKWIKIVVDVFDDEKIKYIETLPNGDAIIVIWFKIICLAGKSNSNGFLMMTSKMPYTEEILSSMFGRDIKLLRLALMTFENLDMIEFIDNKIYLSKWEKHQNIEGLDKVREQSRLRAEKYRNKNKNANNNVTNNVTEPLLITQGNGTEVEEEIEVDKDLDIDLESEKEQEEDLDLKPPKAIQSISEICIQYLGDATGIHTMNVQGYMDTYGAGFVMHILNDIKPKGDTIMLSQLMIRFNEIANNNIQTVDEYIDFYKFNRRN